MVNHWLTDRGPASVVAALLASSKHKGRHCVGLAVVVPALRVCSVLRRFVWLSFVLAACALTPWGVRPGSLTPWGVTLRGVGTLPSSLRAPCKRQPRCQRGVHSVHSCHALPGDGLGQAEGRVTRGTFGCLLVRGLRSFPSWDGQSAEYPGVPSGAAWVRCLVRPGGLRRWRARERWQA